MNPQKQPEDKLQPESLADLSLTEAQAEAAKAGTGAHSSGGGGGAGKVAFQDLHFAAK
jgi:hypothetical protein